MGNMLPFSGLDFFIFIFGFILFLHVFKNILKKVISYKMILFVSIILYISFFIPHAEKILFFLIYVYVVYWIYVSNKYQETLFPIIMTIYYCLNSSKCDI